MTHLSQSGYVWIELPKVDNVEAAQAHCDLVNAMLSKLVGYDVAKAGLDAFSIANQVWKPC